MLERLKGLLWPPTAIPELRQTQIHTATDYGRDILVNSPSGWEHDQQWLWWVDNGTGGGYGNPPPDARGLYGVSAIPAVARCTSLIADTLAGLPWRVYRGYAQMDTPRWITDPQGLRPDGRIPGMGSTNPNAYSAVEFFAQWITQALWFGDGFIWSPRGKDFNGQIQPPLFVLDSTQVSWRDGKYWVGDSPLDMADCIHLRGEPPYTNNGMQDGVIDRFGKDFGLAANMRDYAANIYNTGIPAGYLKVNSPAQITETQADTLKAKWLTNHGGPKRSIAVLNATTEFHPIALSPIDTQLDMAKTWSLRDIALAFGVPAYMLGVPGDPSTYANVESRMTEFRTFTLLPWIRRIESALDAQFPAGTEIKIITDGTLRADTSTRYAAYESALRAGWLTVDEVRALEDRPPLPEQVSTDPADELPPVPEPEPPPPPEPPAEGVGNGETVSETAQAFA